jgi:hypothetical protein
VVRHEPLPTESITPVEDVVRAVQKEAMLLGIAVDDAATPDKDSPLFDAFGLSAPKTAFVSPVQRAAEESAKETSSKADTDAAHEVAAEKPAVDKHAVRVFVADVSKPAGNRGAPSFAAQLKRGNEMLRAAPRAGGGSRP